MENETKKKPKSKLRKIIDGIVVGVFGSIFVVLIAFNITNRVKGENGMIFGTQMPVVLTDSMEPVYMVKDIIVVKKVDPAEIRAGDDITFYYDIMGIGKEMSVTHRIEKVTEHPEIEIGKGRYDFVAHGVNKKSEQCGGGDCTYQKQYFNETKVIGKVVGKSKAMTVFYKTATSIWGLIGFIIAPCLYLVVTSVVDIVKTLKESEDEPVVEGPQIAASIGTKDDPLAGLSDDEKEALKKEMLKEILGGKK